MPGMKLTHATLKVCLPESKSRASYDLKIGKISSPVPIQCIVEPREFLNEVGSATRCRDMPAAASLAHCSNTVSAVKPIPSIR